MRQDSVTAPDLTDLRHGKIEFMPTPPERCECHECTQARWKMSLHGQLAGAMMYPTNPLKLQEKIK